MMLLNLVYYTTLKKSSELFMDQKEILSNISARSDVLDLYPSFLLLEAGIFLT